MAKKTQKGWIKIHKQIIDSAIWEDPLRLKAWIHILLSANYEDKDWYSKSGFVKVKRGQFPTSNRSLQEAWGCSTNTVTRILNQLVDLGMIKVETPKKRYTLITVVKYDVFQNVGYGDRDNDGDIDGDSDRDSDGDNDGVRLKNIKNIKNYKELKNVAQPRVDSIGRTVE